MKSLLRAALAVAAVSLAPVAFAADPPKAAEPPKTAEPPKPAQPPTKTEPPVKPELVVKGPAPAGTWKLKFGSADQPFTLLLVLSEADGKWVGDFIGIDPPIRAEPKVTGVSVKNGTIKFAIVIDGREQLNYEGLLAADGKKMVGSLGTPRGGMELAEMYPSKLKKLDDPAALAKENFAQLDGGQPLFDAGFAVVAKAAEKKLAADEVKAAADKLAKAAEVYGPRWKREVAVRLAKSLTPQEGFAELAAAQAKLAEGMLADEPATVKMDVLDVAAKAYTKAGKAAEAKAATDLLAKLEAEDATEYAKTSVAFETPAFAGRKGKSNRVALVELFTGAECPPCVAADAAFDALLRTYKPGDVLFLEYHLHIPGPDALTNADTEERGTALFADKASTPRVMLNGDEVKRMGGALAVAKDKYKDLTDLIALQLEKPAAATIVVSVAKDEKGLKATAKVTTTEAPGAKLVLRFAVAEEQVRYVGSNGVRFHHMVVRAMPGGAKGIPVAKQAQESSVVVNADEIGKGLTKYLEEFAKTQGEFPSAARPLAPAAKLKLVAFVQDDATGEVLNATQVDLAVK